jgi:hypothetical protein
MRRYTLLAVLLLCGASFTLTDASAESPGYILLPLRTLGVSDTTEAVFRDLLSGELESGGLSVTAASAVGLRLLEGRDACDAAPCAADALHETGSSHVIYGSLSRLGEKVVVRLHALRAGEESPYFSDLISAITEEDLDAVARRFAAGIVSGRPSADRANVDSVTEEESRIPQRRAARRGIGLRAGFIFPVGDSYAKADRLTALKFAFKYETRDFFIETTPVLGVAWGDGNADWTLLDLFAARIFGVGDIASYAGGGLGVHSVRLERKIPVVYDDPYYGGYSYEDVTSQSETTLSLDAGVGLLALRTYSLEIVVDLRYHYIFSDFKELGGKGAHGIALTFGTSG